MRSIEYYKTLLVENPKWLGVQAKEMVEHYIELEKRVVALELENAALRSNVSKSVLHRLIIQKAVQAFGYCPEHGRSVHPEETECPICGRELVKELALKPELEESDED